MTEQTIYDTAVADGMPSNMANLIVAQSRHETGDYTSNAFLQDNNCFGYKYVPGAHWQLPQTGITSSEGDPYAKYASIEDSVHELTHWIGRRQLEGKFPRNLTQMTASAYAVCLKNSGYYGDSIKDYVAGLVKYAQDFSA